MNPPDTDRVPTLTPEARAFLDAPRFAVIATIDPDGAPHQAVVWYRLDGDEIVINSADGRRWPANLRRDPRIHFSVEDGYRYVQARWDGRSPTTTRPSPRPTSPRWPGVITPTSPRRPRTSSAIASGTSTG